ncbi:MAG: hypothetical protein HY714_04370 [Candidatus Omnitrophica bacterium]|nr:hypothetical protein [Candidatus Omnitrophota bacterium]
MKKVVFLWAARYNFENCMSKRLVSLPALAAFGLNAVFAVLDKWSLPEFCWSTWLAALFLSLSCAAMGAVRVFAMTVDKKVFEPRFPVLRRVSNTVFRAGVILSGILSGWIAFRIYVFIFGFYGVFLSVFAEMEPQGFFGRNGFINSDFWGPAGYLAGRYWPMMAGVLAANTGLLLRESPFKLIALPFRSGEIIRTHLMVLLMPFLCLAAWAVFKRDYQPVTIALLLAVFYLVPFRKPGRA